MDEALSDVVKDMLARGRLKILVKANAPKDALLGWDDDKAALRVAIAAPAEDNKANVAIVKFFSRIAGKPVRIARGLTSREKFLALR